MGDDKLFTASVDVELNYPDVTLEGGHGKKAAAAAAAAAAARVVEHLHQVDR